MPEVMQARHLGAARAHSTVKTLYVSPATTTAILKELVICNASGFDDAADLYLVPPGAQASNGHLLLFQLSALAGETRTVADCSTVIESGWSLQVKGNASAGNSGLVVTASGTVIREAL